MSLTIYISQSYGDTRTSENVIKRRFVQKSARMNQKVGYSKVSICNCNRIVTRILLLNAFSCISYKQKRLIIRWFTRRCFVLLTKKWSRRGQRFVAALLGRGRGGRQIKMEPVSGLRPTAVFSFPIRTSRAWLRSNEKPAYLFGKRLPFCSVELKGLMSNFFESLNKRVHG